MSDTEQIHITYWKPEQKRDDRDLTSSRYDLGGVLVEDDWVEVAALVVLYKIVCGVLWSAPSKPKSLQLL